jgi:hypothetical protein
MIERPFAEAFADEWIAAWNSRDLDRILSHYTPDFEFSSPLIPAVTGDPVGRLKGQDAIRAYWHKALALRPDLRFQRVLLLLGVESLVIHYSRQDGALAAEHFEFNREGKVARSSAHYVA